MPRQQAACALDQAQFERLRDLLAEYGGIFIDRTQQRLLEAALAERLAITGLDLTGYENKLRTALTRQEIQSLIELVLNHETYFFRNEPHLRALRTSLLLQMHRRLPAGQPLRVWSAGCASGEEAYSLAIIALEALGNPPLRPIEIIATDLSEEALRRARVGVYRGRSIQHLSPELLARYFQPSGDGYSVGPAVRALVQFSRVNLLDPFPASLRGLQAIFCQNVTIYFQETTRRRLIERFYAALPEGGLLFLGFSETLWNVFEGFHSRDIGGAYVYHKGAWPFANHSDPAQAPRSAPRPARTRNKASEAHTIATPPRYLLRSQPLAEISHDLQAYIDTAQEFLAAGDVDRALAQFALLPANSALAADAYLQAARACADRGDLEHAITFAMRSIKHDPTSEGAYQLLGAIYARQRQWERAAQQLERARYLDPENALTSYRLAEAYRASGRAEAAVREYRNVLMKLVEQPPDTLLDGVAVAWIRDTCQRHLDGQV